MKLCNEVLKSLEKISEGKVAKLGVYSDDKKQAKEIGIYLKKQNLKFTFGKGEPGAYDVLITVNVSELDDKKIDKIIDFIDSKWNVQVEDISKF